MCKPCYMRALGPAINERRKAERRQWSPEKRELEARRQRESKWRRNWRMEPAEVRALYKDGCGICRIELAEADWHVDHCHRTGKVRGILCHKCNIGLGHFNDDPVLFARAAEYVALG